MRLRLGTRASALALAQSRQVARRLEAAVDGLSVELVSISTRGDRYQGPLAEVGGKGLFTAELEEGLVDGSLDLAVHSLKDLPVTLRDELTVAAFPERVDPRDVLISEGAPSLRELPPGSRILTGSLRRTAEILRRRKDVRVLPVRGNVDTRLEKWRRGEGDAVVLAAAGLARLGVDGIPVHALDPETEMLPAPGQGVLALEVRRGGRGEEVCRAIHDEASARAARCERRVVAAFGADCTLPLAAWARPETLADGGEGLRLTALLATPDGRHHAWAEAAGADPEAVSETCITELREAGAEDVLARIRR